MNKKMQAVLTGKEGLCLHSKDVGVFFQLSYFIGGFQHRICDEQYP